MNPLLQRVTEGTAALYLTLPLPSSQPPTPMSPLISQLREAVLRGLHACGAMWRRLEQGCSRVGINLKVPYVLFPLHHTGMMKALLTVRRWGGLRPLSLAATLRISLPAARVCTLHFSRYDPCFLSRFTPTHPHLAAAAIISIRAFPFVSGWGSQQSVSIFHNLTMHCACFQFHCALAPTLRSLRFIGKLWLFRCCLEGASMIIHCFTEYR